MIKNLQIILLHIIVTRQIGMDTDPFDRHADQPLFGKGHVLTKKSTTNRQTVKSSSNRGVIRIKTGTGYRIFQKVQNTDDVTKSGLAEGIDILQRSYRINLQESDGIISCVFIQYNRVILTNMVRVIKRILPKFLPILIFNSQFMPYLFKTREFEKSVLSFVEYGLDIIFFTCKTTKVDMSFYSLSVYKD